MKINAEQSEVIIRFLQANPSILEESLSDQDIKASDEMVELYFNLQMNQGRLVEHMFRYKSFIQHPKFIEFCERSLDYCNNLLQTENKALFLECKTSVYGSLFNLCRDKKLSNFPIKIKAIQNLIIKYSIIEKDGRLKNGLIYEMCRTDARSTVFKDTVNTMLESMKANKQKIDFDMAGEMISYKHLSAENMQLIYGSIMKYAKNHEIQGFTKSFITLTKNHKCPTSILWHMKDWYTKNSDGKWDARVLLSTIENNKNLKTANTATVILDLLQS